MQINISNSSKKFHTFKVIREIIAIFILVALASLHNNLYKNRVRLATFNISTTTSENGADKYFLCAGYIMSLALNFCNFRPGYS